MPNSFFSRSSSGMIVSSSGAIGASVATVSCRIASRVTGIDPHASQDLEAVAEVREGLDVPAAHQVSSAGAPPRSHLVSKSRT